MKVERDSFKLGAEPPRFFRADLHINYLLISFNYLSTQLVPFHSYYKWDASGGPFYKCSAGKTGLNAKQSFFQVLHPHQRSWLFSILTEAAALSNNQPNLLPSSLLSISDRQSKPDLILSLSHPRFQFGSLLFAIRDIAYEQELLLERHKVTGLCSYHF